MNTYSIKISGSGTKQEIAESLRDVANRIFHPTSMGDGLNMSCEDEEWEDCTLITKINLLSEQTLFDRYNEFPVEDFEL